MRPAGEKRRDARALVLGGGVLVAIALAPVGVGLATAVILYELCAGPYGWLSRRLVPRRAAIVTAVAVLVTGTGPLLWLGVELAQRVPAALALIQGAKAGSSSESPAGATGWVQAQLAHATTTAADWLPGVLLPLNRSLAMGLLNWSIALLGLYYLLGSSSANWRRLARVIPLSAAGAESLRVRLHDVTMGIVAGTLLSATIQGLAIGFGFWLAGIPEPLFWGACAAIATLVPVIGNALVWLPALVLMIYQQHYGGAIAIGVFGGLSSPIIDRIVRANVSRRMGSVHPMITLVGALAGARLMGIAGLVLGPVTLAMFLALLEVYTDEYLDPHS